jgi:hypothetical protein
MNIIARYKKKGLSAGDKKGDAVIFKLAWP